jgi:hypothetical protein
VGVGIMPRNGQDMPKRRWHTMLDKKAAISDLLALVLEEALADLDRVRRRYETLQELAAVWVAVDAAKKKRSGGKGAGESRASAG